MGTVEADVLVIGGGATGVGTAYDLALRGLRVVLVERRSLAGGATGAFHGLLHSGARYAVSDPAAAAECAVENRILRRIAAPFIEDAGGVVMELPGDDPSYAGRWVTACAGAGIGCREFAAPEAVAAEPQLNPALQRAFVVPDAAIDSVGVVAACARAAAAHGARILERREVKHVLRSGDRVAGATLDDGTEIRAEVTVNAGGAWAGRIAETAGCAVPMRAGKGVLVAMSPRLCRRVISRCRLPGDGDLAVPAGPLTVVGTSDLPIAEPDEAVVQEPEIRAMVEAGAEMIPALRAADVAWAWAGVRPLFTEHQSAASDREVSRRHYLLDHRARDGVDGFVTITGGKFTTFRRMAEDAADLVGARLGVSASCRTADEPLSTGPTPPA